MSKFDKKPAVYYARVFSWMRKRGIRLMQDQREFLAEYEKQHGKVPAKTLNEWKEYPV